MLFNDLAIVSDLWVLETNSRKRKETIVHGREYHSLSWRRSGQVRFEVDGKHFVSEGGDVTFMPAGKNYHTEVVEAGSMIVIHFKTAHPLPDADAIFLKDGGEDLRTIFEELLERYHPGEDRIYKYMSLLYALLDKLERRLRPIPKRMRLAKGFIDRHFAEELSIRALAYASGLSDVHFRNEFKRIFGIAPLAYVKQLRVDCAKRLLRSGYYTISEAATESGFASVSYFSSEFKRLTGMTPSEYEKQE